MSPQLEPRYQNLLRPSLDARAIPVPYSLRACYLVGFFGGGLAAAIFCALCARKFRTLNRDLSWLIPAGLGTLAWNAYGVHYCARSWDWSREEIKTLSSGVNHALGLAIVGVFYLLHSRRWRASAFTSEPPSGVAPGLVVIGISLAVTLAAVLGIRGIGGSGVE